MAVTFVYNNNDDDHNYHHHHYYYDIIMHRNYGTKNLNQTMHTCSVSLNHIKL